MADENKFRQEDNNKLDEMLDSMLASYSTAEPRPGLETRILAQVREQGEKRNRGWILGWIWTAAAVVSAAIVLILIYMSRPGLKPASPEIANSPQKQEHVAAEQTASTPEVPSAPRVHPRVPSGRNHIAAVNAPTRPEVAVVKQEVFPSPSPLSEQEKLLLRYLQSTPQQEMIAQSRPDPPPQAEDNDRSDNDSSNNDQPKKLTRVHQTNSNTR